VHRKHFLKHRKEEQIHANCEFALYINCLSEQIYGERDQFSRLPDQISGVPDQFFRRTRSIFRATRSILWGTRSVFIAT